MIFLPQCPWAQVVSISKNHSRAFLPLGHLAALPLHRHTGDARYVCKDYALRLHPTARFLGPNPSLGIGKLAVSFHVTPQRTEILENYAEPQPLPWDRFSVACVEYWKCSFRKMCSILGAPGCACYLPWQRHLLILAQLEQYDSGTYYM